MAVNFRPAKVEDCFYFEEHMRDQDKIEAACISIKARGDLLIDCLTHSDESHVAYTDDKKKPFAIFGVGQSSALGDGVPWFCATDDLIFNKKLFLKCSKEILEAWLNMYGRLWNVVHQDNDKAINFLTHLGFTFGEKAWGLNESVMIEFYKEKS